MKGSDIIIYLIAGVVAWYIVTHTSLLDKLTDRMVEYTNSKSSTEITTEQNSCCCD